MAQTVKNPPETREWQPSPVFLPGEFHGQKSLVGYSPWSYKGLAQLSKFHTHSHSSSQSDLFSRVVVG